ncbi:19911_t:CDS:2 [Cetraspora pellucida]|uniref:19911_t:CDS:1 n=1 Tax=Cetraspora pellucida TaxID=1433469 RepID=A0A9N9PBN9_9GLOM|nr:19911_t:CDS:2 [Cetraspora pellucida]
MLLLAVKYQRFKNANEVKNAASEKAAKRSKNKVSYKRSYSIYFITDDDNITVILENVRKTTEILLEIKEWIKDNTTYRHYQKEVTINEWKDHFDTYKNMDYPQVMSINVENECK